MEELKPCPCGNTDVDYRFEPGDCGQSSTPWSMFCSNMDCPWEFGWFATKEEVKNAWNTRATDPLMEGMIQVLEAQKLVQGKIFYLLNQFASGETQNEYVRIEPIAVLAQVYGDLAAEHSAIIKVLQSVENKEKK